MLDDLGLLPALKWLAREVSRTSGIHVEVVAETDAEELPEDHRTCVYRVVQEAAHNAVRHSGAHQIRIHVQLTAPGRLRVSIQDDGKGFAPSQSTGVGILGMEERIHRLGGTMQVESQPDQRHDCFVRVTAAGVTFVRLMPVSCFLGTEIRCPLYSPRPIVTVSVEIATLVCSTFCIAGGTRNVLTMPKTRTSCGCS